MADTQKITYGKKFNSLKEAYKYRIKTLVNLIIEKNNELWEDDYKYTNRIDSEFYSTARDYRNNELSYVISHKEEMFAGLKDMTRDELKDLDEVLQGILHPEVFHKCHTIAPIANIAGAMGSIKVIKFGSAEGYGIALDRSHFCIIKNNHTKNHRHGILLNHGNSNCIIEKNIVEICSTRASIDLHGEYNYFNVIRSNLIKNGKTGIIIGGGGKVHYNDGPYNCIVDNEINDCNNGIEINNESVSTIIGKNRFNEIKKENIVLNSIDKKNLIYLNE